MLEIDIYKYNLDNPTYIDDWTSISDIGKKFHGKILTYQNYLQEEDRYVNTIQELLQFFHVTNSSGTKLFTTACTMYPIKQAYIVFL